MQHLRGMLETPERYRCRRDLTEAVIKAFLTVYYDVTHPMRPKLMLVASNGTHQARCRRSACCHRAGARITAACPHAHCVPPRQEEALVVIDKQQGYPCGGVAPLVVPNVRGRSLLVYHRGAASQYRAELAAWVAGKANLPVREAHATAAAAPSRPVLLPP